MIRVHRELRAAHRQLLDAGATVRRTGSGHLRYRLPDGRSITLPASPSDWRSVRNSKADVRRLLAG